MRLRVVPGHEGIGRIEALGPAVSRWKIGQRVGVGLIAGADGVCEPCKRGDMVNCQNPVVSGVTADGGYAEVMIAEARGIASIPEELDSREAAPLLCAGVTTYNALRNAGLRGEIRSLFRELAGLDTSVSSLRDRWAFVRLRSDADATRKSFRKIRARISIYIDAAAEDAAAGLQRMGAARAILATGTSGDAMGRLVAGLAPRGKLIVVGAPGDPIQLSTTPLIFGGRSVYGTLTGTPIDSEDTLAFSVWRISAR